MLNNKAFACIWIILSIVLCVAFFEVYNKNTSDIVVSNSLPINNQMLALFFIIISLVSFAMGVFFLIFSDELQTYFRNYHRTKEI